MVPKKHRLGFKLLVIFLVVLGITAISVGGWFFSVMSGLNQEYPSDEMILGEGQKQALIIYQPSNNETTKNVANELAQQLVDQEYCVKMNYPSGELKQMAAWFDNSNRIDALKVGKADPALMNWFLEQSRQNWEEHKNTGYITVHNVNDSKLDAITGATMK